MAELGESMMQRRVRREVRSPRAAALAGIVYTILMSIGMSLTYNLADFARRISPRSGCKAGPIRSLIIGYPPP